FYYFFQAEDGIRDFHVTGVQTCALPIFRSESPARSRWLRLRPGPKRRFQPPAWLLWKRELPTRASPGLPLSVARRNWRGRLPPRSEERRVGKEGRSPSQR